MMTTLDAIVITFLVLSGLSFLGILVMLLGKKEIVKTIGFYYTTLAAVGLTAINVIYHPPFSILVLLVNIAFGVLAIAAFILHIEKKTPEMRKAARIMTAVSMMAAIIDLALM